MYHIFISHSPITYLASVSIIKYRKLDLSKCIVFDQKGGYDHHISTISLFDHVTFLEKIKYFFNLPKLYDKKINELIGDDDFECYLPMMSQLSSVLISHSSCKKVHFIEEGTTSYIVNRSYDYQSQNFRIFSWRERVFSKNFFLSIFKLLRGYNLKLMSFPVYYEAYVNCKDIKFWGFSSEAFPVANKEDKVILQMRDIVEDGMSASYNFSKEDLIFITDDCVERYGVPINEYLKLIDDNIVDYVKRNNIRKVYIKSHPHEKQDKIDKVNDLLKKRMIDVEYIKPDTILEIELCFHESLVLIGFDSTLLLYGSFLGHLSYSIPRKMKRVGNGDLPVFNKYVQEI